MNENILRIKIPSVYKLDFEPKLTKEVEFWKEFKNTIEVEDPLVVRKALFIKNDSYDLRHYLSYWEAKVND